MRLLKRKSKPIIPHFINKDSFTKLGSVMSNVSSYN